jgi:hypothetical protein
MVATTLHKCNWEVVILCCVDASETQIFHELNTTIPDSRTLKKILNGQIVRMLMDD